MDMKISNRLFELRRKMGLSQEELSEKLMVSRQAVSKWERGEASPDTDNLIALAKLYGISVDELLLYEPTSKTYATETAKEADVISDSNDVSDNEKSCADDSNENKQDDFSRNNKYKSYVFSFRHDRDKTHQYHTDCSYAPNSKNEPQEYEGVKTSPLFNAFRAFPYPILCVICYLLIGFLGNNWHPSWIIFLTILPYYMIIETIASNGKVPFPFFSIVLIAYLIMGFTWDLWHPGWVVFLTVPLYHLITSAIKNKFTNIVSYPALCAIIYIVIGLSINLWHPTWLIFLTIPLYESVANSVRRAIKYGNEKNNVKID
ncbi:MAG: helix-turn-helix transcriptional regulator [Clostridia bacterium]